MFVFVNKFAPPTHTAIISSKLTIEPLEQGVKYKLNKLINIKK